MSSFHAKATDALKRLRTEEDGVVSFEYVIVAACMVGAVTAAFGTSAGGNVATVLTSGISTIVAAISAAV
ncbi:hypothetical protein JQ600_31875 [Bradyrhizobium sp. AUGA SZCCT0176]|uniref:hypothetical protein n=1 Tax=Bradyrhizobium sp. AUGA SZCCT0176 TaxID=2807664 RepID=UPI001BAA29E3|nr:hypothetical protein [Bradyrhizobium sp. AUGA SZCCT0176]MBR1229492.1 hypothetical protein [Bradyrhizobium sp. AUGA SZCCT0176]